MTQSHEAIKLMKGELNYREPDGFGGDRDYMMLCHGCGSIFLLRAGFVSTPIYVQFSFADGSRLNFPTHGCETCVHGPSDAIRNAYYHGMTREAYNRAADRLGARRRESSTPEQLAEAERAQGVE